VRQAWLSPVLAACALGGTVTMTLGAAAGCGARTDLPTYRTAESAVFLSAGSFQVVRASKTWTWDGKAWAQLAAKGPPGRSEAVMAPLAGAVVLFGGGQPCDLCPVDGGFSSFVPLFDTWTWDGTEWSELNARGPSPFGGGRAVMARLGGSLVFLDGRTSADDNLGETWTWDGQTWTQLDAPGPPPRHEAVMAPLEAKLVLFGGLQGPEPTKTSRADTWTWDGRRWTERNVSGPSGRGAAVMAPLDGNLVLFGGAPGTNTTLGDTWLWDGAKWTEMHVPGPPGRASAVMVPFADKLVLFGGYNYDCNCDLRDTWTWDGAQWTELHVPGPPPASSVGGVMAGP
jgi:hypothetical protein